MSKEIVLKEPTDLITLAIEKGADLDKIEKLLKIQREYNADIARNEYHAAMASFKTSPLRIEKDKKVNFGAGKAAYSHASLYNVVSKCSAELSKWGLSAAWKTNQANGLISVTCSITHKLGHSEETTLSAGADTSGSKNSIQAVGSTVTYLQRYTLLSLLGLATVDQDDDGNQVEVETIDEKQYSQLLDHINNEELNEAQVCRFLGVEDLRKLPKSHFQKGLRLKKAVKKNG